MNQPHMPFVERRRLPRAELQWTVYVAHRLEARFIESKTRSLSSKGVYFLTEEEFALGEHIRCVIEVPTHKGRYGSIVVESTARVVRIEREPGARFGVACEIEDYTITSPAVAGSVATGAATQGGRYATDS